MSGCRIQSFKAILEDCERRKALLRSFIDQLEILAPPAAATAVDKYRFHPEIEGVKWATVSRISRIRLLLEF